MNYKTYNFNSYQIYTLETKKFKNCYIEVNFRGNAKDTNLAQRIFLGNYMYYLTRKYPSRRQMRIQTEELYNASLGTNTVRIGYNLFTDFSIDFLNPRFVLEKNYLEDVVRFLFQIITDPMFIENENSLKSISLLKEHFHEDIDSVKENPGAFAMVDSKKKLFGDSISGSRLVENHEDIEKITLESLKQEYEEMMTNCYCEIMIAGDLDMQKVVSIIRDCFHKSSIVSTPIPFQVSNHFKRFHIEEVQSTYEQTQIFLYYRLDSFSDFEKHYCLPIFKQILSSAGMSDKLTMALRVKKSLCYGVFFHFQTTDQIAYIRVGLSYRNVKVALQEIRKAMKEMATKQIKPSFLKTQKEKFLMDLKLREDDLYGLIDQYYFHEIGYSPKYEEYLKMIPKVTLDDLQRVAKKMHETMLYILRETK